MHGEDVYKRQILEEGILSIMDEEGAGQYRVDHFAPNSVGRPVRGYMAVSYTHLDVYKRQRIMITARVTRGMRQECASVILFRQY